MATEPSASPPRGLDAQGLDRLAALSAESASQRIDHALSIAREVLDMDVGYMTEFVDGEQVYRGLSGDAASFDMSTGDGYPLDGTYCKRMIEGKIPRVVSNTAENAELRELALTKLAAIGAYIGVPIILSDGTLYGTICTISHDAQPELGDRDLRLMEVLAHIVASGVEQERLENENARLRVLIAKMGNQLADVEEDVRLATIMGSGEFTRIEE
jgi:GAF domain-containing protein